MIKTFYRHVLDKKDSRCGKSTALREAMLEAIKENREAPEKWGGFFLTGLN